jgi:dihydroxyacetone kinase
MKYVISVQKGIESLGRVGDSKRGDRTMLDSLIPACEILIESLKSGQSLKEALQKSVQAAKEGSESTKQMFPKK